MNIILLSFILLFSACGPKTNLSPLKARTKVSTSLLLLENGCKNGNATSASFDSVQEFIKIYDDFIRSDENVHLSLVSEVGRIPDHFKSSAFKPHIMGEASIEKKLNMFKKKFYALKESGETNISIWNELGQELKRLNSLSSRLKAQKCSINRLKNAQKNDLRDYIKMNERKELFVCQTNETQDKCNNRFVMELAKNDKDSLLRMCMRYHSVGFCGREFNRAYPNKLVTFFQHYFNQQQNEFNSFFQIHKKGPFSCQSEQGLKKLTIKTRGFSQVWQRSFMNKDLFIKAVNNSWGIKDNLEIDLIEVSSEEDIFIKFEDSMISFVNGDNSNNMTLSLGLSGEQLLSVFTHELGHVFGFRDCYVEFFNPRESNLIYYTLDGNQSNLMCEITKEATVPLSYKEQLLNSYCLGK